LQLESIHSADNQEFFILVCRKTIPVENLLRNETLWHKITENKASLGDMAAAAAAILTAGSMLAYSKLSARRRHFINTYSYTICSARNYFAVFCLKWFLCKK